jgi:hypothetical protein
MKKFNIDKLIKYLNEYQKDNNAALFCTTSEEYINGSIDTINDVLNAIKRINTENNRE